MKDWLKDWLKMELSNGKEPEIPVVGESIALYAKPQKQETALSWECGIGSFYAGGNGRGHVLGKCAGLCQCA